jgi:hypothetical protein
MMKSSQHKPMFVPSQLKQLNAYNTVPLSKTISKPPMLNNPSPSFNSTFQQVNNERSNTVILSSAPKLYTRPNVPTVELPPSHSQYSAVSNVPTVAATNYNITQLHFDVSNSKAASAAPSTSASAGPSNKKSKGEKSQQNLDAQDIIKAAKASSALQSFGTGKDRRKVDKKTIRNIGGQTWEDQTLLDWEEDDFRIFCGDLGNDVNDELLTRTFGKFPSFQKAKVVRDKRTNKTKGYGFISFKDPQDFIKAMKEFDGKYVGSRPIKLRKSTWKQRGIEERRKKDAEKKALLNLINK